MLKMVLMEIIRSEEELPIYVFAVWGILPVCVEDLFHGLYKCDEVENVK